MTVFIDTNVFFGAAVEEDAHHVRARQVLRDLIDETQVTSDHVVIETWNLLASRRGRDLAIRFWINLRNAPIVVESATPVDLEYAYSIATRSDHDFDIVDCTSFAMMERLGITRAASFDKDFAAYRTSSETRAFEIIR